MKVKIYFLGFMAVVCLALFGCADPEGLHDQRAALVTFEFTGFGEDFSGDFAIPGDFNSWKNTEAVITVTKGEGTSKQISVTSSNIVFSLVTVNAWTRPWYSAGVLEGNGFDGTQNKYHNFYYDGLDLSAGEITIVIDGSTGTATPVVK